MDAELPQRSRLLTSVGIALALYAAALGWFWGARARAAAPDRPTPTPVQAHLVTPAARAAAVPVPEIAPPLRARPAPLSAADDGGTVDPAPTPPSENGGDTRSGVGAATDEPRATLAQATPAPNSESGRPTVGAATLGTATAPLRVAYDVQGEAKGLPYRAAATLTWHVAADRYTLELALRAFLVGERVQRSTGLLRAEGPVPLRFEDRARRERVLQFDWPADAPDGSARRDDGTVYDPVPRGAQDRLSVFAQLGGILSAASGSVSAGQRWLIPVVGLGGLEHWTFETVGWDRLSLPAGETDALHVRRLVTERALDVDLWYSPALPGLPVRIVLQQPNGDRVDQRLREWPAMPSS